MNNELILKLARESELAELYDRYVHFAMSNSDDDIMDFDTVVGKFAELIVQECAKTVNDTEYPYEDQSHTGTWDACCVWSASKLKEHFGVE